MWDARLPAAAGDDRRRGRPLDRSLMALALALFVCAVVVDRARRGSFARR
jgi:hypothetical protein